MFHKVRAADVLPYCHVIIITATGVPKVFLGKPLGVAGQ